MNTENEVSGTWCMLSFDVQIYPFSMQKWA